MLTVVATTASVDEVAQLREQVVQLQTKLDRRARRQARGRQPRADAAARPRLRAGRAVADRGLRAGRRCLDSNRYVETMAPIAESPAVQQAVADKLRRGDLQQGRLRLADALRVPPAQVDPLAPALAPSGCRTPSANRIDAFLSPALDRFETLWVEAGRMRSARARRRAADDRRVGASEARREHRLPRLRAGRGPHPPPPSTSAAWIASPRRSRRASTAALRSSNPKAS